MRQRGPRAWKCHGHNADKDKARPRRAALSPRDTTGAHTATHHTEHLKNRSSANNIHVIVPTCEKFK